ncbi:MAG: hypothetical protein ACQKBW_07660, partial [Puniceicoccales bacterium]
RSPESLDVLVPVYLPELPVDPFAEPGTGFHYVPEEETFRLWAGGQDGEDDGGLDIVDEYKEDDVVFRGRRAVWNDGS